MRLIIACIVILLSSAVSAQTVTADRFTFNTGPCVLRSGSGSPEGVVTGNVCDTFWRTDTGQIYTKTSGSGNTGWSTSGLTGSGTANTIAKWTSSSNLSNSSITDDGSAILFSNTGDINFNPGGDDLLPTNGYEINLGNIQKKYLTLHAAELWVETLVAQDTIATIGGRILVGPTTHMVTDFLVSDIIMEVKHNELEVGDVFYMESNGKVEFMSIFAGPTGSFPSFSYQVTRNLDGSGQNDWYAGDALFNTGQTGDGFIDIYSLRGVKAGSEAGPTIVGNRRNSSTYNDWSPRWAIGNLNGLYSYTATTYGAGFGDPNESWIQIDANKIVGGFGRSGSSGLDGWNFWLEDGDAWFKGILQIQGSGSTVADNTLSNVTTIDGGKITTNTLNADRIVANTITAAKIASSAIETDELAADSVTSAKIVANTIVAADIASGTITATQIATGTITADRMNVSSLSAISANMGTLTAGSITGGTIDGATINAGSGDEVVLNSSGITLTAGSATNNKVKWSDSSQIFSESGSIQIDATVGNGGVTIRADNDLALEAGIDGSGRVTMSASAAPRISNFSGLGANRFVCHDNNGDTYSSGTTCDGSAPAPQARIQALETEVAELRALVQQLLATQR